MFQNHFISVYTQTVIHEGTCESDSFGAVSKIFLLVSDKLNILVYN